ncbi:MAG TPA: helix-turn-helix domain-containing protein [Pyrinomonadaceae bacterium]|jgi:excisionase family DNA binding protein
MTPKQQKALKEIVRRGLHNLADEAANVFDEFFTVLSEIEPAREAAPTPEVASELPHTVQTDKAILKKIEVAALLRISTRSVNALMNEGLPFFNTGRNVRFNREKVLSWVENRKIKRRRKNHLRVVK